MLGKLMKEEFKATQRVFFLLLALLLGASITVSLFFYPWVSGSAMYSFKIAGAERVTEWLAMISIILFTVVIISSVVVAFVVIIQRFYKSLLGDEGYLMFTLPVPNWQHIAAKGLVAMCWILIAALTGALSAMIMTRSFSLVPEAFFALHEFIMDIATEITMPYAWIMVQLVLMVFFSITRWLLVIYSAIAIGHLWTNHRLLGAFLSYLALQILTSFLTGLSRYGIAKHIVNSDNVSSLLSRASYIILGSNTVFNILLSVVLFVLTNYILTKHLNLE